MSKYYCYHGMKLNATVKIMIEISYLMKKQN